MASKDNVSYKLILLEIANRLGIIFLCSELLNKKEKKERVYMMTLVFRWAHFYFNVFC